MKGRKGRTLKQRVERTIGDQVLAIETGFLAKQAAGSVLVTYGETVVLAACATGAPRPGIDFFPLTCDYRERVAAAGKLRPLRSNSRRPRARPSDENQLHLETGLVTVRR